jgi:hypothetical protein
MTVGPLPAAVYWRRRVIVLGALLVAIVTFWSACSGPPEKSNARKSPTGGSSPLPEQPAPSASASVLTPIVDGSIAPTVPSFPPVVPSNPVPAPPPTDQPVVACTDADLMLIAAPEPITAPRGAYVRLNLKVKNVSPRPCTRDLGADHQELYLQSGTTKIWSSDSCDARTGSAPTLMQPNIEHLFNIAWNGRATNAGCVTRPVPDAGKYQLVARLDTKLSDPAMLDLT